MARYVKINTVLEWLKIIAEAKSYTVKRALCYEYAKILRNPQHAQEIDGIISDVAEVRHGEWIKFRLGDDDFVLRYKCSLCGRCIFPGTEQNLDEYPYCHCGAKMDGGRKEADR